MPATKTDLTNELLAITGAKDGKYLFVRLKFANLLDCCSRCGGCGQYSYCQMYGTKCFGCNGTGLQMPKLTSKLVDRVKEVFTAEVRANYEADMAARGESKRKVEEYRKMVHNTPLELAYRAACAEGKEKGGCKGWMDECDYAEANYPKVVKAYMGRFENNRRVADGVIDGAKRKIDAILDKIIQGKVFDKATRSYKAADWVAIEAELKPLIEELYRLGQVPA